MMAREPQMPAMALGPASVSPRSTITVSCSICSSTGSNLTCQRSARHLQSISSSLKAINVKQVLKRALDTTAWPLLKSGGGALILKLNGS